MVTRETPDTGGPPIVLIALVVALFGSNVFWAVKSHNSRLYYASGIEKINSKHFSGAISDFEKALWQNPDDPAAHFGIGWAYQMTGQEKESVQHYTQAIGLSEDLLGYSLNNLQYIMQNQKNAPAAEKLQKARGLVTQLQGLR